MCHLCPSNTFRNFITTAGLILISACGSSHSDKEIQDRISTALTENTAYRNVAPAVKDGVVTLNGNCEGSHCATDVEDKVKSIDGVRKVENHIVTEENTDLTLRTSVQAIISKYDGVQADVAAGVVVLRGVIERAQLQPLMNELEALKPKKIDNQLAVKQ